MVSVVAFEEDQEAGMVVVDCLVTMVVVAEDLGVVIIVMELLIHLVVVVRVTIALVDLLVEVLSAVDLVGVHSEEWAAVGLAILTNEDLLVVSVVPIEDLRGDTLVILATIEIYFDLFVNKFASFHFAI